MQQGLGVCGGMGGIAGRAHEAPQAGRRVRGLQWGVGDAVGQRREQREMGRDGGPGLPPGLSSWPQFPNLQAASAGAPPGQVSPVAQCPHSQEGQCWVVPAFPVPYPRSL